MTFSAQQYIVLWHYPTTGKTIRFVYFALLVEKYVRGDLLSNRVANRNEMFVFCTLHVVMNSY